MPGGPRDGTRALRRAPTSGDPARQASAHDGAKEQQAIARACTAASAASAASSSSAAAAAAAAAARYWPPDESPQPPARTQGEPAPPRRGLPRTAPPRTMPSPRPLSPKYDGQQGEGCPSLAFWQPARPLPTPARAPSWAGVGWAGSDSEEDLADDGNAVLGTQPDAVPGDIPTDMSGAVSGDTPGAVPGAKRGLAACRAPRWEDADRIPTGTRVFTFTRAPPSSADVASSVTPPIVYPAPFYSHVADLPETGKRRMHTRPTRLIAF